MSAIDVPAVLTFIVTTDDEGGFVAIADGHGIVTQGDDLDELRHMIEDAIDAYYFDSEKRPSVYHLVFALETVTK